jgi:predicted transcriptional regulator
MKTYKSEKTKKTAYSQIDWERRMFILVKKNQGWTVRRIAAKLDLSTARVHKVLQDISGMTVSELENEYQNWLLTTSKK